jgi:hypothetical protein
MTTLLPSVPSRGEAPTIATERGVNRGERRKCGTAIFASARLSVCCRLVSAAKVSIRSGPAEGEGQTPQVGIEPAGSQDWPRLRPPDSAGMPRGSGLLADTLLSPSGQDAASGRRWYATDSGSKPGFWATERLRAVLAQRANFRPFSAEFVSHIRRWCLRNVRLAAECANMARGEGIDSRARAWNFHPPTPLSRSVTG